MVTIISMVSDLLFGGLFSVLKLCTPAIDECIFKGAWLKWLGNLLGLIGCGGG